MLIISKVARAVLPSHENVVTLHGKTLTDNQKKSYQYEKDLHDMDAAGNVGWHRQRTEW